MMKTESEKPVLAIGDCHGHLDRLEALLLQEGLIGPCGMCGGEGDVGSEEMEFCSNCFGVGTARLHHDAIVVQLGDLGHFGATSSPTADAMIYHFAKGWLDKILWGNHDRAVVDDGHAFGGYMAPLPETKHLMRLMIHTGQLTLAYEAHGFLLTHAGLHAAFKQNELPEAVGRNDPVALAHYLQSLDQHWLEDEPFPSSISDKEARSFMAIRDAIGNRRGGGSPYGGLLWRDANESLYQGFRQVFGHTKGDRVRRYYTPLGDSYCIDIGDATNGKLAGVWLPEERVVLTHADKHDRLVG